MQVRVALLDPDSDALAQRAAEIGESAESLAGGVRLAEARLRELADSCEIDGTFLEVEALVDEGEVTVALDDIRAVLVELGIELKELTRETYTGAVATRRR
ncbi:hypothetical protein [Streptomyces sp. NPDC101455]|uniref:hypothetical protein n=1 Tax=Streptomyces sp. NPDC101455 TaxID=3366142 RepID=UPI00380743B7